MAGKQVQATDKQLKATEKNNNNNKKTIIGSAELCKMA